MKRARFRGDRGVTLPELLITIMISGVILGSISASLILTMRAQSPIAGRLSTSRYEQLLSTLLPGDVAGAVAIGGGDTAAATGTGCATTPAGTNILRLTQVDGSTSVTSYVSYRVQQVATVWQLTRTSCASGGTAATRLIVDNLASATSVAVTPALTSITAVDAVTMTVNTTSDGQNYAFKIVGSSRSTLAPVTTVAAGASPTTVVAPSTTSTSTTTTTTTTTTTKPATTTTVAPCAYVASSATPITIRKAAGSSTNLLTSYNLRVTTSGVCGTIYLAFTPGSGSIQTPVATRNVNFWTVAVATNTYSWTLGAKTVQVVNYLPNGDYVILGTYTLTVTT
jgi:prepilin-type N-terminal cleavage/methylation domain-containing protein